MSPRVPAIRFRVSLHVDDLVVFLALHETDLCLTRAIMEFFVDASILRTNVPVHAHPVHGRSYCLGPTLVPLPGDYLFVLLHWGSPLHSHAQEGQPHAASQRGGGPSVEMEVGPNVQGRSHDLG
jgi:hypothetical protein